MSVEFNLSKLRDFRTPPSSHQGSRGPLIGLIFVLVLILGVVYFLTRSTQPSTPTPAAPEKTQEVALPQPTGINIRWSVEPGAIRTYMVSRTWDNPTSLSSQFRCCLYTLPGEAINVLECLASGSLPEAKNAPASTFLWFSKDPSEVFFQSSHPERLPSEDQALLQFFFTLQKENIGNDWVSDNDTTKVYRVSGPVTTTGAPVQVTLFGEMEPALRLDPITEATPEKGVRRVEVRGSAKLRQGPEWFTFTGRITLREINQAWIPDNAEYQAVLAGTPAQKLSFKIASEPDPKRGPDEALKKDWSEAFAEKAAYFQKCQAVLKEGAQPDKSTTVKTTPPPSENKDPELYEVQPGDTLSRIAKKVYNDPGKFSLIMTANNMTSNIVLPGTKLKIPKLPTPKTAEPEKTEPKTPVIKSVIKTPAPKTTVPPPAPKTGGLDTGLE